MREGKGRSALRERDKHESVDDSECLGESCGELCGEETADEETQLYAASLGEGETLEQQVLNEHKREDAREEAANNAADKDDAVIQLKPLPLHPFKLYH